MKVKSPSLFLKKRTVTFNQPFLAGKEVEYMLQAVHSQQISGNGPFTKKCHAFFEERFGFRKVLLTTSCTDALEMSALLAGIKPGDEVIVPSYTYVSTANAFVLRGARIVFADSSPVSPHIDPSSLESLVNPSTKAIVAVHYGGVACDMDAILNLAKKYNLLVIEDAAQAIASFYKGRPLGSLGHLAAFSFHETKNIISGEGGMIVVSDERFRERAEIIWEKGTNRAAFSRNEVDKYEWMDIGSSFLPSDLTAAYLYAQLEELDKIQAKRTQLWESYDENLKGLEKKGCVRLPVVPEDATQNGNLFYLLCSDRKERDALIAYLREQGIYAVFHYLPLHESPFYRDKHDGRALPQANRYADCMVRLPLYYDLTRDDVDYVSSQVAQFFTS